MNRAELLDLIITTLRDLIENDPDIRVDTLDETTQLFGKGGLLDSLRLVGLILDVEQQINDQLDAAFVLADSRAMSQRNSPFRTIGSLADYILLLIEEQQVA